MKESKLGLDFKKIEYAKNIAKNISNDVQTFVDSYSTVAVERTLCRLMGIDGVDSNEVPLLYNQKFHKQFYLNLR
jgi:beta-lysine 5,6-aminomutase alpha subunit